MKIANITIALLFLLFAVLQYNDPDPGLWIPYYLFAAAASMLAARGILPFWLIILGLVISIIWMGILIPGVMDWIREGMPSITGSMKADTPYIEIMREFLGVFMVLLSFLFLLYQGKNHRLQRY